MKLLDRIPDRAFEGAGTLVGVLASVFVALQIHTELAHSGPSSLSSAYVLGFLAIFLFWTVYGLRFGRLAIWLTNAIAGVFQSVLLCIILLK